MSKAANVLLDIEPLLRVLTAQQRARESVDKGIPRITLDRADRICCRVGIHPCEVWGDAWWEASHRQWERSSRWSVHPILARGYTHADIDRIVGKRVGHHGHISRSHARKIAEGLGLEPASLWDEWEWIGP
jgi:hypothetical protein